MDRGIYKTCLECVHKLFANILRLDFKSVEKVSIKDLEIDCDFEVFESILLLNIHSFSYFLLKVLEKLLFVYFIAFMVN